eukprot:CAMPEP_0198216516 /NCGR_PEP_ID=MMETSP1445-20131203/58061_1 /TAXON_ID=36898 /ORGANISM="Pyramimonas sp., Strain CCMP2087" /LENGTH=304 /DNA_ID=CAMNT_0043892797 /DNA_START=67 /DNA_END=981 /DNA_ORIENTATION=+
MDRRGDLDAIEAELLRRNEEIEAIGAGAAQAAEEALHNQAGRQTETDLNDEVIRQALRQASLGTEPSSEVGRSPRPTSGNSSARRPSSSRRVTTNQEGTSGVTEDVAARLNKARLKSLQEEIKEANKELQAKEKLAKETEEGMTKLRAENAELQKKNKALTQQATKSKRTGGEAAAMAAAKEEELASLRKEASKEQKVQKQAETDTRAKEVRLNRALEEVERYKRLLEDAKEASRGGQDIVKVEFDKLKSDNKRLEKQKQELMNAFNKQLKLLDVLKKQKIHLEAARMLAFTEEEFMKTLESRF